MKLIYVIEVHYDMFPMGNGLCNNDILQVTQNNYGTFPFMGRILLQKLLLSWSLWPPFRYVKVQQKDITVSQRKYCKEKV